MRGGTACAQIAMARMGTAQDLTGELRTPADGELVHGPSVRNAPMSQPPRSVFGFPSRLAAAGVVSLTLVDVLAACGASSKPAYCSDIANFKNSAQELTHVSSASGLVTQAEKVASSGQTALASRTSRGGQRETEPSRS